MFYNPAVDRLKDAAIAAEGHTTKNAEVTLTMTEPGVRITARNKLAGVTTHRTVPWADVDKEDDALLKSIHAVLREAGAL